MVEIEIVLPEEMAEECSLCIDYLRKERKLSPTQCYVVIRTMYEEFPKDYIPKEVVEMLDKSADSGNYADGIKGIPEEGSNK